MHEKIDIICKIHGVFKQTPSNHIHNSNGCPKCFGCRLSILKQDNMSVFVEKSRMVHGDTYDYTNVVYKNSHTYVDIICKIHGGFSQRPDHHISGSGCRKCCGKDKTTNDFINEALDKHEHFYTYDKAEYISSAHKISITCPIHGDFLQKANNHLNGKGCPKCVSSKGERKIRSWLIDRGIIFEQEKSFCDCKHIGFLYFDFYIESLNILIEFDGRQHFESVCYFGGDLALTENKIRDLIKDDYAHHNNIKLIRIHHNDIQKIPEILSREIP